MGSQSSFRLVALVTAADLYRIGYMFPCRHSSVRELILAHAISRQSPLEALNKTILSSKHRVRYHSSRVGTQPSIPAHRRGISCRRMITNITQVLLRSPPYRVHCSKWIEAGPLTSERLPEPLAQRKLSSEVSLPGAENAYV